MKINLRLLSRSVARKATGLLIPLALIATPVVAQSPRQQAQDAAGAATGVQSVVKSPVGQLQNKVPGFETANPQSLSRHYDNDGAGLEDATLQLLGNDEDGAGGEAATTMIETYTTRPDINVTRTDQFLSQARGVLGNPDALAGDLFSTNQNPACRPTEVNPDPLEIKSCDVFRAPGEAKCTVGTEVDVLAEKVYACLTETPTYRKLCTEELTARCTQVLSNCRIEDGLVTTPNADLQLSYVNFRHRARLPNIDIGGGCQSFTRRMIVNIADIDKLAVARLSRVDYHDALSVFVNGVFVWGGPYGDGSTRNLYGEWVSGVGRDDLIIRTIGIGDPNSSAIVPQTNVTRTYLGSCRQPSNTITTPGVNIKPLMRQGANTIEFRNTIGGIGGFTADFQILMNCCGNWEETWERQCPY